MDRSSRRIPTAIKHGLTLFFVVLCLGTGQAQARDILVLGDSISAAYGMELEQGWVALLQENLGEEYEVINASISGETTSGGRGRLPNLLTEFEPDLVIIELGGNDGLRGMPTQSIEANLDAMVSMSLETGAEVLLLGMRIPPNYGDRYTELFFSTFHKVAERYSVPLVPFFLEGVATKKELMQNDGIHPNQTGQPLLLKNLLPTLENFL